MALHRSLARYTVAATAALAAFVATPTQAQVAGWYEATSSDGSWFSMVLANDNGQLSVAQWGFAGDITCASGTKRHTDYAFGVWSPASSHENLETADDDVYAHLTGDFSADSTSFTGSFVFKEPLFVDVAANTRKTEVCGVGVHHFVATLQQQSVTHVPALASGEVLHRR